jgi:hypothetical protein
MRHLKADWKRWSPVERTTAVVLLVSVLLAPITVPLLAVGP